jgi:hypothetical protein
MQETNLHHNTSASRHEEFGNDSTPNNSLGQIVTLLPGDLESLCSAPPISPHRGLLFNKSTWKKVLHATLDLFKETKVDKHLKKLSKSRYLTFDSWCSVQKILANTQSLRTTADMWTIVNSWKKHIPFDIYKALSGKIVPEDMTWQPNPENLKAGDLVGFTDDGSDEIITAYVHHTLGKIVMLYISNSPPICVYTSRDCLFSLKPTYLQEEREAALADYHRAINHLEAQCLEPLESTEDPVPIILGATARPLGSYTSSDITLAFAPEEYVEDAQTRLRNRFPTIDVHSFNTLKRHKHPPLYS